MTRILEGAGARGYTEAAIAYLDEIAEGRSHPANLTPDVAAPSLRNALAIRFGIQKSVDALCVGLALCIADQEPGNDRVLIDLIVGRLEMLIPQMRLQGSQ